MAGAAGLGVNSCHVAQLFIHCCACLNIADIRWMNECVVISYGCLLLSASGYQMLAAFDHAIMTYLAIACFKLKAFRLTSKPSYGLGLVVVSYS